MVKIHPDPTSGVSVVSTHKGELEPGGDSAPNAAPNSTLEMIIAKSL
jgi:hypothetical protein